MSVERDRGDWRSATKVTVGGVGRSGGGRAEIGAAILELGLVGKNRRGEIAAKQECIPVRIPVRMYAAAREMRITPRLGRCRARASVLATAPNIRHGERLTESKLF